MPESKSPLEKLEEWIEKHKFLVTLQPGKDEWNIYLPELLQKLQSLKQEEEKMVNEMCEHAIMDYDNNPDPKPNYYQSKFGKK